MRLTLLFLILSSTLLAQELTLSGTVVSAPEGTPLTGAYVYPKTDPGRVVVTDGEGQFSLALAQPDTLMVSYLGYQELRRFVEASGKIQLTLRPSAAASIEALTVRARRIRDGELASERIGQMDIYLNPAAKADPLLAVNTLPAATNPDETANVSFRGSPTAATGVYLNEVPIRSAVRIDQSNGVGQFSIFGQIPMREVQVYPSSPPVNFSQTSAGAVGLYTSTDLPTKREYGLSLSMAGMGLAHNRPLGKKSGVRMYLNYSNLSAFRFANQQGLPELQRSRAVDGAVQFVSQPSQRTDVQFFYLGFRESYRFTTRTPYYTGDFEQEKPRHLAVLNWRWRGDKWTWRFNQSADWERATFQLGNIQTIPRRFTGHLATHGRYERDGFSLQVGAALNHYDDFVNGTFPLVDYELRPEDPAGSYQQKTNHQLAEVYAYGQWRLGEDWLLGAGIKPVTELAKGNIYPTVQAALRYSPSPYHRFNLGGGHFSQFLTPGADARAWQWLQLSQVALEYGYSHSGWTADAAVYAKRENYALSPDLQVTGSELRVGYEDGPWTGWVSGAVVRSKSVDTEIPTGRDLPYLARAQVQREFTGQWTVGLAATFRRGRYFLPVIGREPLPGRAEWFAPIFAAPDAGQRLPAYQRVDLSASKMLLVGDAQLILYLNCNNLLNHENIRNYTYDATYSERMAEVYSRRLVFVGGVLRWGS